MIRRKVVSPISAFPQEGRWIKGKHGFFIIRTGESEQAEIADRAQNSPLFELARLLVRFDHVAGLVVNANHSIL